MSLNPPSQAPSAEDEGRAKLQGYTLLHHLGSGRFAEVSAYRCERSGRQVAIKKVSREAHRGGINLGALKELQVLQELSAHPNLVSLLDVFAFGERMHLVLELCDFSLDSVARDTRVALPEAAVKGIMQQLLQGLAHVHGRRFMHRDIKPENVLVAGGGVCKLADFGLAAATAPSAAAAPASSSPAPLHHAVVTLWYRAPELLMRSATHGAAVDMWSMGCLLAELLLRAPIFPGCPSGAGEEEAAQLAAIARLLGAPVDPLADAPAARRALAASGLRQCDLEAMLGGQAPGRGLSAPMPIWPGCAALPGMPGMPEGLSPQPWRTMHPALAAASSACVDLLSRLLVWDPLLRLTVGEALAHPWFTSTPLPAHPRDLPKSFSGSE